ncbi:helix-turn-helix transcriptional regulator [Fluoribacter gormanii]|uniref:DNA-binding transcriptional regulator, CsgD family n=1 Tax=Fluoribacter gormanii TaxID=464 RepID=A0A377GG43_9GAMM|nr:helix-turn-helix transcriptional regulator [Fluoribacter gormanii]KTD02790.1 Response regulator containing a CheY-like receiver domain and an HTH DNA-binding domain protein [Fluoribacter gormanii]SIR58408.1 DNA-binding transcriptional regulator, CsgD family [Fluoribacter gormanii]STO23807.1 LuxR family transcriptional regulatory, chaperone HchA-associated [Fluoribacter gormanii]
MYELNDSPYFIYSNLIKEYCLPLFSLSPIKGFTFCRTYEDKTAFLLTTEYQFNVECIQREKRISKLEMLRTPMHTLEGYFLNSPALDGKSSAFYETTAQKFGYGYSFTIVRKHEDYSDYFHFIGNKYQIDMNNYYVHNKASLNKFCDYFIERAAKLLTYSEKQNKFILPDTAVEPFPIKSYAGTLDEFFKDYSLERSGIKSISLSQRQIECARLLIIGKTAEEIAIILGLSKRTIEHYIDILKRKLNAHNKGLLITKLIQFFPDEFTSIS